ncbi:MAG: preprotein translocase subunit SecG [Patescibacteria group bacterium]|nr:preprotein translocase subunit SecG [Patescibacteria group bacterium]
MKEVLLVLNIIISLLVVVFILMQGRGAGLGGAWGGGGETYQTRRGVELLTMRLTVFFIIAFFVVSAINFFL